MSCFRCGDPLDDFNRLDREQAAHEAQLPKCDYCGEPIQDERLYLINGEFICPECMDSNFKKWTEDYAQQH